MKKKQFIWVSILLFLVAGGVLHAQMVLLDMAIEDGAKQIEAKLEAGVTVVLLNFKSPSERVANYVLDELRDILVKGGKVTVVDKASLAPIQQEMNLQLTGDVNDRSAQAVGKRLGAQSIVSGSIEVDGINYRMRLRTIEVETTDVQVSSTFGVSRDALIVTMMGNTANRPESSNNRRESRRSRR